MATGRVVRFDELRGYGFIAPDDGGEDVFVHANTLDGEDQKALLTPGAPVEFEMLNSGRGPKALSVKVFNGSAARQPGATPAAGKVTPSTSDHPHTHSANADDDGLCDVLSQRTFMAETTEMLLTSMPDLTAAQVVQIRRKVTELARSHGWLED